MMDAIEIEQWMRTHRTSLVEQAEEVDVDLFVEMHSWARPLHREGYEREGGLMSQLPRLWLRDGTPVPREVVAGMLGTMFATCPPVGSAQADEESPLRVISFTDVRPDLAMFIFEQARAELEPWAAREFGASLLDVFRSGQRDTSRHKPLFPSSRDDRLAHAWMAWGAGLIGGMGTGVELVRMLLDRFDAYADGDRSRETQDWTKALWKICKRLDAPVVRLLIVGAQPAQRKWRKRVEMWRQAMARELAVHVDELSVHVLGDVDGGSELVFPIDGQDYRVTLDDQLAAALRAPDGTIHAGPPIDLERSGTEHMATLQRWVLLHELMPSVLEAIGRGMRGMMRREVRWSPARWRRVFVEPPLMQLLAEHTLWEAFPARAPGDQEQGRCFRVCADLTLADVEDEPFELEASMVVGLANPLELEADEVAQWREVFLDYEIVEAFAQLGERDVS